MEFLITGTKDSVVPPCCPVTCKAVRYTARSPFLLVVVVVVVVVIVIAVVFVLFWFDFVCVVFVKLLSFRCVSTPVTAPEYQL